MRRGRPLNTTRTAAVSLSRRQVGGFQRCVGAARDVPVHSGRLFTTAALFAEGEREIDQWHRQGWAAVDMETATTFAVATHFAMGRLAILFAYDNPRKRRHILLDREEETIRRRHGNEQMIKAAFDVIRDYPDGG